MEVHGVLYLSWSHSSFLLSQYIYKGSIYKRQLRALVNSDDEIEYLRLLLMHELRD